MKYEKFKNYFLILGLLFYQNVIFPLKNNEMLATAASFMTGAYHALRGGPVKTYFFVDKRHYVPGGVKFTYPVKHFSTTPFVFASVELSKVENSPELLFSPIVVSSTVDEVVVRVNKTKSGIFAHVVKDAGENDVIVNVFAIGY